MSDKLETLKTELGMLCSQDRAELAQFLIGTLGPEVDDDVDDAWDTEVARRVAEIRSGRVVGKPSSQVFAELRERFP